MLLVPLLVATADDREVKELSPAKENEESPSSIQALPANNNNNTWPQRQQSRCRECGRGESPAEGGDFLA